MCHRFWYSQDQCECLLSLFYRKSKKVGTSDYMKVMRLRKIWAEGTFAVLKREHKLNKIQNRDLQKATEECLLSAKALNLKRLVKAV
ncbi:transposase [Claveliimonas monacensis]|nr:transposase [Claveliimonas monacensis]